IAQPDEMLLRTGYGLAFTRGLINYFARLSTVCRSALTEPADGGVDEELFRKRPLQEVEPLAACRRQDSTARYDSLRMVIQSNQFGNRQARQAAAGQGDALVPGESGIGQGRVARHKVQLLFPAGIEI